MLIKKHTNTLHVIKQTSVTRGKVHFIAESGVKGSPPLKLQKN